MWLICYSQTWTVLSWHLAAQLTRLGDWVALLPLTLAGLQAICQADRSTALTLVAHKLLVADSLWEVRAHYLTRSASYHTKYTYTYTSHLCEAPQWIKIKLGAYTVTASGISAHFCRRNPQASGGSEYTNLRPRPSVIARLPQFAMCGLPNTAQT